MKNAIADKELIAEQLKKQMSPEDQAIVKKMSAAQKDELFAGNADYSAALSNEKAVTKEWGMGGDSNRALNAVTIAITGALGGQTDLQVASNALAPYAAQVIGQQFGHGEDKNTAAQMVSHAILGATLAYVNGGNPAAGGSAAVASEAAATYFTNQYKDDARYQNEKGEFIPNLLPEDVKTQIRDLTTAIGAVAGGTVGDSAFNAQIAGVVGQNAVENNGFSIIDENYGKVVKENTKEKGISVEEAETQLTRGALYNIDEGWKDAFDSKLDASDIAEYNLAYQYLLAQTKDSSVDEINSNFYNYTNSKGTIVVIGRLNSYAGHISDSELQKADSYIGEAGKGFIATAEDFKNKDIFLTNTLAGNTNEGSEYYNDKKEFIQNSAAIKDSEISFFEGLSSSVDRDISEAKGAVIGVATGAKDTAIGIYEFLKHPIDNTKELISAAADAVKNPAQTAKNVSEGMNQGLEKYNTTIDLYKMQKDEGAEAEYKANIAGQIVGAGGVGAAGKKGTEAVLDSVKKAQQVAKEAEIAEALRKKQSIENNVNAENPSFGDSAIRNFQPGTTHRAEHINAGQVTDRDDLPRIDGNKNTADKILAENMGQDKLTPEQRWSTQRPAWKNGTLVTDHILTEPRTFTMVIDQKAYDKMISDNVKFADKSTSLGGWATDTPINSISDMRNLLAVPQEWKSGKLYTVEFVAKPGTQIREGTVGDMWSTDTKERLSGGGHQVEFKTHPGGNPQLFEVNLNSIKEIK